MEYLKNWMENRQEQFVPLDTNALVFKLHSETGMMNFYYYTDENYEEVSFAVWSTENEQRDIQWYSSTRQTDGSWVVAVPMEDFLSDGQFTVHVYSGGTILTGHTVYAESSQVFLSIIYDSETEFGQTIKLSLHNAENYTNVRFAVWSEENGQDDLQWYQVKKDENGDWSMEYEQGKNVTDESYIVHVYGELSGEDVFITGKSF